MRAQRYGYRALGLFVEHDSFAYRLLGAVVWKPYYWVIYRQEPYLRAFMIKRRIWGGEHITVERKEQLRVLFAEVFETDEMGA